MARHDYPLSDETINVINGHATEVAEHFGCNPSHIYNILGGTETDAFSRFLWLFSSAVKAGCNVTPYLSRLEAVQAKYAKDDAGCVDAETAKLMRESADVAVAQIEHRTTERKLIEVDELIAQAEITRKALINELSGRVSTTVRNQVSRLEAVKRRQA
jgi:desulfoferrodoxin (superoxide reductase-like protein)